MKEKRGQFYLIAAIILIAILVGLLLRLNEARVSKQPLAFSESAENFEKEAIKIIDDGISKGKTLEQVQRDLRDFAGNYTEYISSKSPQIGFLYVYGNASNITVVNFLVQPDATISTQGSVTNTTGGSALLLNRLKLEVGGEEFVRDFAVKAKTFKGINIASGKGEFVNLTIGGIPYYLTVKSPLEFQTLTIQCDQVTGECFVKLSS